MISSRHVTKKLLFISLSLLLFTNLSARKPPKQLTQVINHFLDMDSTSLVIHQVIDWRFSGKNDSIKFQMDIKGDRAFHVDLSAFGLEIYVTQDEMMTVNHSRQQILYENASSDALIEQLFVGGDLGDARFKREKQIDRGLRQLDFQFVSDFSDWESLSVVVDQQDDLKNMILEDYDGNKYLISLHYEKEYDDFVLPDLSQEYLHFQIADLRK
jgi:hypothetical protein